MNGNKYLADTNAFVYLLQKHPALRSLVQVEWFYSFITEIELLGKPSIKPDEVKIVRQVLEATTKAVHSESINEIAITLKQKLSIKTPDAIIAATAFGIRLASSNCRQGFYENKVSRSRSDRTLNFSHTKPVCDLLLS